MSDYSRSQWQPYLDRATQDRIGRELRVIFAEPLAQPLPDKLLGALRAIQDAETARRPREARCCPATVAGLGNSLDSRFRANLALTALSET